MRVLVDVPEDIAARYRNNPFTSREELVKAGYSHHEARVFAYIMQKGQHVYHHEVALPKNGTFKYGLLPDLHFPYHDPRAVDIAINWLLKHNMDGIVVQGDGVDCYQISYWKTDPTKPIFAKEVEQAKKCIRKYICEPFPHQEKVWIEGNHELRLRNLLWSGAAQLAGLEALTIPKIYGLEETGFKYVSNPELQKQNLEPFSLGKLYILHGHEIKVSHGAVNVARLHYIKNPVNQINAHHHQNQYYPMRKIDRSEDGSWTVGCLCDLNPDYAPINAWNHGFAVVEFDEDGLFEVWLKRIIDGRVV